MKQYLWHSPEERAQNEFKDISGYFVREEKRMKERKNWSRLTWSEGYGLRANQPGRSQDLWGVCVFLIRNIPQLAFQGDAKALLLTKDQKENACVSFFGEQTKSRLPCQLCHITELGGEASQHKGCNFNVQFFFSTFPSWSQNNASVLPSTSLTIFHFHA